jgi:hypothetical protein
MNPTIECIRMVCFSKPVYTRAFVYNITDGTDNYIGSTEVSLEERLKKHENSYKSYLEGKYHYVSSFDIIKKGNYRIELLEECNVNNTHELRVIEGTYQQKVKCVNKLIAGLTHKESMKKYCETHKVEIAENKKKYREAHKETIAENKKKYYEAHKAELVERTKKWYETHKVEVAERTKKYQEENAVKLKEKFNCECGGKYTHSGKSQHEKTKKHINYFMN